MKRHVRSFVALSASALVAVGLAGCSGGDEGSTTSAAPAASDAELVNLTYSVGGMTCEGCVNGITTTVKRLPGVAGCDVSLDEGRMVVRVTDPATGDAVVDAVRRMNFTVAPVGAEAPAGETAGG